MIHIIIHSQQSSVKQALHLVMLVIVTICGQTLSAAAPFQVASTFPPFSEQGKVISTIQEGGTEGLERRRDRRASKKEGQKG